MMFRAWEDDTARFLWAWGLAPSDTSAPRDEQTTDLFHVIEKTLAAHDLAFSDVVRTWFYCDDINDWYAEFNGARSAFFEANGVFERYIPASTGIGHPNPFGAAVIAGFFAMRPKTADAKFFEVKSPLQADAMSYKSSFSRAAETVSASGRRLFVSGTASILPNSGEVAFVGDPEKQIDCAMRAALAIVESRGMSVRDVTRAIVYLKEPSYRPLWRAWLKKQGLPLTFATELVAEVCRPDWLFEVELDAQRKNI